MLRLPRARLHDARREAAPRALVREKEADRPGADDQDIEIGGAGRIISSLISQTNTTENTKLNQQKNNNSIHK